MAHTIAANTKFIPPALSSQMAKGFFFFVTSHWGKLNLKESIILWRTYKSILAISAFSVLGISSYLLFLLCSPISLAWLLILSSAFLEEM